jgi:hypothetical protein
MVHKKRGPDASPAPSPRMNHGDTRWLNYRLIPPKRKPSATNLRDGTIFMRRSIGCGLDGAATSPEQAGTMVPIVQP